MDAADFTRQKAAAKTADPGVIRTLRRKQ